MNKHLVVDQKSKKWKNNVRRNILKWVSFASVLIVFSVFIFLIVFIVRESVIGFNHFGFKRIFLSNQFNFQDDNSGVSFWFPFSISLFMMLVALIIAGYLGIKSAIFIHFRIKNKSFKKYINLFIKILAGVPSVVFGIFARNYLGELIKFIFNLNTSFNLITGSFMLAFMILPTIIFLITEALNSVDTAYLSNSVALGVSRTRGIYKVILRKIYPSILIALLIASGRAIGETMAVSMILQSEAYVGAFGQGFVGFISSSVTPLGAVIATNMFSDGSGPLVKSLLFGFGIVMLVVVLILNGIIFVLVESRQKKRFRLEKNFPKYFLCKNWVSTKRKKTFSWVLWNIEKTVYPKAKTLEQQKKIDLATYVTYRNQKHKFDWIPDMYKKTTEVVSSIIVLGFISWIMLVILINGLNAWFDPASTVFKYGKDTTGAAFLTTILIILVSILVSFPVALLAAIYLNEYCKKRKIKNTILFIIQVLGSTPSILFAIFGLAFFILTLGLTASGMQGRSIFVGALTISIVILPNLIQMIQNELALIPLEQRYSSYALGVSRSYTVFKIVLPAAFRGIVSSIILIISRIMGETAPLYLTAGLSSGRYFALNQPGQTITTRIYNQIYNNNSNQAFHIMFEGALLSVILIGLIIVLINLLLPWILANTKYSFKYFIWLEIMRWKIKKTKILIKWAKLVYQFNLNKLNDQKYAAKIDAYQMALTNQILQIKK